MGKQKFDPDWMKDPEVMKEIIREQMIEYGEVIAEQAKRIKELEEYNEALQETSVLNGDLIVKYEGAIKKAFLQIDLVHTGESDADHALEYVLKYLKEALS